MQNIDMDTSSECHYRKSGYQDDRIEVDDTEPLIKPPCRRAEASFRTWTCTRITCLLLGAFNLIAFVFAEVSLYNQQQSVDHEHYPEHEQSIIHLNHQRWAKVLQKLRDGKAVTFGFHGGSITAEGLNTYHVQLAHLLNETFPINERWYVNDTTVKRDRWTRKPLHRMINRGANAMTSDAASLCVGQSFIDVEVDVVSLEYAVNDGFGIGQFESSDPIIAFSPTDNMERFARGYLGRPNGPAIMMPLFKTTTGVTAEEQHMKAAMHYGIPTVSWNDEYLSDWRSAIGAYADKYQITKIYNRDDRHPNDDGHQIMAQLIRSMIKRMFDSFIISNGQELGYAGALSRPVKGRRSLLEAPPSPLPDPMNPKILYTSSAQSFCRLVFRTFSGHESDRQPDTKVDDNVYQTVGIEWNPGDRYRKPSFCPTDVNARGQSITFQSPVPFTTGAVLFFTQTWNSTWANGTVHLASSTHGAECNTTAFPFQSVWKSPSTQNSAILTWSIRHNHGNDRSCVRDLMTITKTSPGDMRINGFYAN